MLARDRLLARVAAFPEVDRTGVEPGFGRENTVVDLAAEPRRPGLDPQELELVLPHGRLELGVEHLDRRHPVVGIRDPVRLAEDDRGRVLLDLDVALGREAGAEKRGAHSFAEARLGQQEKVLHAAPPHGQRRDHARLRREEQRFARVADRELLDVVRDHRLEVRLGIRPPHADEVARSRSYP